MNNAAASVPTAGMKLAGCEKVLAVAISVPGRRLGALAVADKESRDGRVLDFTPTDARLLALFANQAAAAIETARLHKDAIEKERIERELEVAAAIQRQILPRDLPQRRGAGDRREERAHAPGRRRLLRLLPAFERAPGLSRGGRLRQGRSRRAARVDGPRGGAPPDRRGADGGRAHRPHRPAPAEVRGDAQVPDVLLRAARARLGHAAVRVRRAQSRAAAPGLRGPRPAQGDRRPDRDVSQRLLAGGHGHDGAGRSALRLQRRHHGGARRGGRGVRSRPPVPADDRGRRRAGSARGCSTPWRRLPATCRSTTTRPSSCSGGARAGSDRIRPCARQSS